MSSDQSKKTERAPPGQGKSRSARRRRAARKGKPKHKDVFSAPVTTRSLQVSGNFLRSYAGCLDNPFMNPPVRLGFGTLVDTEIALCRYTSLFTANSTDGALLLLAKPNAHYPLAYSVALTGGVPAWGQVPDAAWATAFGQYSSARPISMGIRVTPISAATDKPCRIVGSTFSMNCEDNLPLLATIDGITHQSWYQSHLGSKQVLASGGGSTALYSWRPMSLENFMFKQCFLEDTSQLLSPARIAATVGPSLYLAISGPVSMQYDVEVLYYYEALPNVNAISVGTTDGAPGASDYFPSLETFYKAASSLLTKENVVRLASVAEGYGYSFNNYIPTPKTRMFSSIFPRSSEVEEKKSEVLIDEDYSAGEEDGRSSAPPDRRSLRTRLRQA